MKWTLTTTTLLIALSGCITETEESGLPAPVVTRYGELQAETIWVSHAVVAVELRNESAVAWAELDVDSGTATVSILDGEEPLELHDLDLADDPSQLADMLFEFWSTVNVNEGDVDPPSANAPQDISIERNMSGFSCDYFDHWYPYHLACVPHGYFLSGSVCGACGYNYLQRYGDDCIMCVG